MESNHPTLEELQLLSTGNDPELNARVDEHIRACEQCSKRVFELIIELLSP